MVDINQIHQEIERRIGDGPNLLSKLEQRTELVDILSGYTLSKDQLTELAKRVWNTFQDAEGNKKKNLSTLTPFLYVYESNAHYTEVKPLSSKEHFEKIEEKEEDETEGREVVFAVDSSGEEQLVFADSQDTEKETGERAKKFLKRVGGEKEEEVSEEIEEIEEKKIVEGKATKKIGRIKKKNRKKEFLQRIGEWEEAEEMEEENVIRYDEEEVRNIISNLLNQISAVKEIENLEVRISNHHVEIKATIKVQQIIKTTVELEWTMFESASGLKILINKMSATKYPEKVRKVISKQLDTLPERIKEYFEKIHKKRIESVGIEDDRLILLFAEEDFDLPESEKKETRIKKIITKAEWLREKSHIPQVYQKAISKETYEQMINENSKIRKSLLKVKKLRKKTYIPEIYKKLMGKEEGIEVTEDTSNIEVEVPVVTIYPEDEENWVDSVVEEWGLEEAIEKLEEQKKKNEKRDEQLDSFLVSFEKLIEKKEREEK